MSCQGKATDIHLTSNPFNQSCFSMQHVSEMALTLLEQYLSTVITLSSAQPIFEHKGGHVPIAFFSHPFLVISNEKEFMEP